MLRSWGRSVSRQIDYCGEGPLDGALARRLILHVGAQPGNDYITPRRARGVRSLDARIQGLCLAARHGRRLLVLRDLDRDAPCAGALIASLLPQPEPHLCLRIAVRASEAWLLADRDGIAEALAIAKNLVPAAPDLLDNPKIRLAEIASQSSRPDIRRIFAGSHQERSGWTAEFIAEKWDITRAVKSNGSASLAKAVQRLRMLAT
jgi:hypothetical protein